ncbi:MAG: DNA mismatch repair protein MutS [Acidobacteria bacterium]|nr:MAG: DNA mismatch repair protein MutS [Acidobacteriota bacterium]
MKKKTSFDEKLYPPVLDLAEDVDDEEVFRQAMSGVRPLPEGATKIRVRRTTELPTGRTGGEPPPEEEEEDPERVFLRAVEEANDLEIFQTNEYVEGGTQAWDPRLLKKLREGGFAVQAELDLHGFSQKEAVERLEEFVQDCCRRGLTCVRIIHGRGKNSPSPVPVLKNGVERWLSRRRSSRFVAAYTSARLVDGGGGAMYVLLKCA